jgi:iron complex outermembrane receptor protein
MAQDNVGEASRPKGLEEVIVTAQKREQGLQDVPISVQAFSQQKIEALSAQDIGDLGAFTPNVEIGRGANQPNYKIRGIGTSDFGVGADPSVGVYLDGVYIGRSGGSKTAFNDIARIEILNGPQGTLFGRNAAAGAIQYITNKPVDDTEGWVKATVGDYDRFQVEGVYNMALTDELFWRTGVLKNKRDGYIDNLNGGSDLNEEDNWSITTALRWVPTDKLDVLFRFEYDNVDQDSRASSSAVFGPREGKSFENTYMEQGLEESRDLYGASLHLTYELEYATFTSISSYREYDSKNPEDKDGTAMVEYRFDDLNEEDNSQWSQEFRFNGDIGDSFRWLAGINYNHEDADQTSGIDLSTIAVDKLITESEVGVPYDAVTPGFGFDIAFSPLGFPDIPRIYDNGVEALAAGEYSERIDVSGDYDSWAVFGDVTYSITDTLDITAGLRYTEDSKDFSRNVKYNDFGIWFAWPETSRDENGNYDPNSGVQGTVSQTQSWDDTTGRLVLDWHVMDDVLLYASYSEGYKAGGFSSASPRHDDPPFDPEEIDTWEVGIKSSWFDNTLRLNGAYFDYNYDNLQEQNFVEAECLGADFGAYIFETSDIEGSGYELSLNWLALPGLEFFASAGTTDADVASRDRCKVVDNTPVQVDESGDKFADTFSYTVGVNYSYDIASAGEVTLSVAWAQEKDDNDRLSCTIGVDQGDGTSAIYGFQTIDDQFVVSNNSAVAPISEPFIDACPDFDDKEQLNARLAYFSASGNWEVGAWVTNATDWDDEGDPGGLGGDLQSDCCSDGSPAWDRRERPRMYGMDLRYNF